MKKAAAHIRETAIGLALAFLFASSAAAQEPRATPQGSPPIPEAATEAQGFIVEPDVITRVAIFGDRHLAGDGASSGFFIEDGNMISGAGWISVGPGYRYWAKNDRFVADASTGISWRGYKMAQARFEMPKLARSRVTLGSQIRWQDFGQVPFYGEGPETLDTSVSEYRVKSKNLVGYATLRPVKWFDIDAEVGWLKPSIHQRAGLFMRDRPNTSDVFPGDPVFALDQQPAFVHSGVAMTADTRDFPGHPTRGGLLRVAAANYSDRDAGLFSFRRYETEGAGFIPLAGSRVVVALHGWLVTSDPGEGQVVPFYLQPGLGGHNSLRGYGDYRFHDQNMASVNIETRVAMMTHLDAAFFVDAGNVAARVGDLNFDKRSYGAGIRLHSRRQTFARVDLARGDEGWRFVFRLNDPLQLGRLARRTAPIPFAP